MNEGFQKLARRKKIERFISRETSRLGKASPIGRFIETNRFGSDPQLQVFHNMQCFLYSLGSVLKWIV